MATDLERAREIFLHVVGRLPADQWDAYVGEACGGDAGLAGRVRHLLRAHVDAGSFLEGPVADLSATVDQPPAAEGPGTVVGPYKLLEQIGEGGFGAVFLAEQTEPVRRKVALKVLKPGMDSRQVIARFEAERQALAIMDHPHIARVFDGGVTPSGRPYFVMELVKGVPITDFCDQQHLTPRQRLELFVSVCQAVQHAHQKGIIHRDLKPSNVLVSRHDTTPVVKVIDFGVAKALGQELTDKTLFTGVAQMIGTPLYMSPEQAGMSDLDVDTRSDIYSLGVLLYELLTGTTPFPKERFRKAAYDEIRRIIREEEPPKPSTRLSDSTDSLPSISALRNTEPAKLTRLVRGELDWIVMKALEKDRSRRYETANGFAVDVQRYLAGEAVQAVPPSAAYRLKKFVRRNKGPVLAVAVVLVTLLAGIVGTAWQAVRAEQARLAEAERADGERMAKERAEANFALANEAVEKYLGTVNSDRELKQAGFHRLRKKLLESALPFFQKLTAQKGDAPEVEAGRGRAHGRLARVRAALGEDQAAVRDDEAARAIFVRLVTDFPDVPAYQHRLATSLSSLGRSLSRVGRRAEAEAHYRRALDIRVKLLADFPADPEYRRGLATTHDYLGSVLAELGQPEAAEGHLRQAVAIGEKVVEDFPNVLRYRLELADSHNNLAVLLDDQGKREETEAVHRRALDVQAKLAAAFPEEPDYRQDLAGSHNNLGLLLSDLGKHDQAEELLRQAVAIGEKLIDEYPRLPVYRQDLAGSHFSLGNVLDELNKREEAEAAYRRALDIHARLADEFPTVPAYRRALAGSLNNLGLVIKDLGRHEEAEAAYRRALLVQEKLVADFPAVPVHAVELGGNYCNFGTLVRGRGQPEASLDWYRKAIATLEPVVAKEPRRAAAREFLRNSHHGRAEALDDLGRYAEATRDWERALGLDDGSRKALFRMRIFRNKKDAAGCLATAAAHEALGGTDAGGMYNAACYRAVCAAVIPEDPRTPQADAPRLAKEQADQAMAWLHKAVAAGYRNADHMKQDKDLDALRGREDFKKLLADLQAKTK